MSSIFDRLTSDGKEDPFDSNGDSERGASVPPASNGDMVESPSRTLSEVKQVTQELLKHGYLEEHPKADLFRKAVLYQREVMAVLEPLDLEMRLDTHRGVAFLTVARTAGENVADDDARSDDAWGHPLVRRQRLTLEQSLLIAILRQAFVIHEQETGIGHSVAKISVDDLLPQFMTYFGDSGSDARNETRLLNLLEQLKPYGFVSEVDNKQELTIRPLIAYLANPESLVALLNVLQAHTQSPRAEEPEA